MSTKPKRGFMSPPPRTRVGQRRPSAAFVDMYSARLRRSSDASTMGQDRQRSASETFKTSPFNDDTIRSSDDDSEFSKSVISQTLSLKSEKTKTKIGKLSMFKSRGRKKSKSVTSHSSSPEPDPPSEGNVSALAEMFESRARGGPGGSSGGMPRRRVIHRERRVSSSSTADTASTTSKREEGTTSRGSKKEGQKDRKPDTKDQKQSFISRAFRKQKDGKSDKNENSTNKVNNSVRKPEDVMSDSESETTEKINRSRRPSVSQRSILGSISEMDRGGVGDDELDVDLATELLQRSDTNSPDSTIVDSVKPAISFLTMSTLLKNFSAGFSSDSNSQLEDELMPYTSSYKGFRKAFSRSRQNKKQMTNVTDTQLKAKVDYKLKSSYTRWKSTIGKKHFGSSFEMKKADSIESETESESTTDNEVDEFLNSRKTSFVARISYTESESESEDYNSDSGVDINVKSALEAQPFGVTIATDTESESDESETSSSSGPSIVLPKKRNCGHGNFIKHITVQKKHVAAKLPFPRFDKWPAYLKTSTTPSINIEKKSLEEPVPVDPEEKEQAKDGGETPSIGTGSVAEKPKQKDSSPIPAAKQSLAKTESPKKPLKYYSPEKLKSRSTNGNSESTSDSGADVKGNKPRPKSKSTVESPNKKKDKESGESLRVRLGLSPSIKRRSLSPRSTRI